MATAAKPDTSASTAVATRPKHQPGAIERLITSEKARAFIEPFLPKGTDIQRVAASVMLAIQKDETGTLRRCTPQSLVLSVVQIQQWGLELAPGVAYLLPFKNTKKSKPDAPVYEAVPCADYKALAQMMVASGAVRYVETAEVREGDSFEHIRGLEPKLVHRPSGASGRTQKRITHVYCILHLPFGARAAESMTAEEVDAIRQQFSKQHKTGALSAWYAKKTIIRQVAKTLPKDKRLAEFFKVLESDVRAEVAEETPAHIVDVAEEEDRPHGEAADDRDANGEEPIDLDDKWIEAMERDSDSR